MEQIIRSSDEKAASQAKKAAKKVKPTGPKRKPGRLKGSKNKPKADVILNPELLRIQSMLNALLLLNHTLLQPVYFAKGGHFGNYPAFCMVRQCGLHIIAAFRCSPLFCLH